MKDREMKQAHNPENLELETLRVRLAEAEETLRAIYEGEVDALVVKRPEGDQVFTLRGAETPYRLLLEAMNEGALTINSEGTVLYCNNRFAGMAQRPIESLVASSWQQCFSPQDHAALQSLMTQAQSGGGKGEFALLAGDGSSLPVEVSVRSFRMDETEGFSVLVTDITERKRNELALLDVNQELEGRVRERTFDLSIANEQLQKLNRTLKALQESSQALTRATSENEYLDEVCKRVLGNCGYALVWIGFAEQDEARSVRPVAHAGFDEGYLDSLKITWADTERGRGPTGTAIRTGKPYLCSNKLTHPGMEPWRAEALKRGYFSSLVVPLLSEGKAFGNITVISRQVDAFSDDEVRLLAQLADDVSNCIRSLRAGSARRRAERRTAVLAETASQLLGSNEPQRAVDDVCAKALEFLDCQVFLNYLVDETQQRLRLNSCSGFPPSEIAGMEWQDYGAGLCGCAARDRARVVATNIQGSSDQRTEAVRRNGMTAGASHPLLAAGVLLGTLAFGTRTRTAFTEDELSFMKAVSDLVATAIERKRTQTAMQLAAEELRRSNHELEQFAYIASHDLQEPLHAVDGYVKLLKGRFPQNVDPKSQEFIDGAIEGAERMQLLIRDLLSFARVGERGQPFKPTELGDILNEALRTLQIRIKSARAKVTHDPMPRLAIDATQIMQIFQNLLSNALKFRAEERPLEVHIGAHKEPGRWVFSVRDNGIGIEPKYFERIFQIFQRLHTRKHYAGTGIGLAICKKMVERHNGNIWVQSEPGQGATFYFSLPET